MDDKIVENMKNVLKRTKKEKFIKNNKICKDHDVKEDNDISELMTKKWQMKTPPANKDELYSESNKFNSNVVKEQVNAFDKMMSRKSNPDFLCQNNQMKSPFTLETEDVEGKNVKKSSKILNVIKATNQASLRDESNNVFYNETYVGRDQIIKNLNSTKKRVFVERLDNVSTKKKRKIKYNKVKLDLKENSIDNIQETHHNERPRRSCANKINYSVFSSSPEKESPEKKKSFAKFEIEEIETSNLNCPDRVELIENAQFAPIFFNLKKGKEVEQVVETPKLLCAVPTESLIFHESPEKNSEKTALCSRLQLNYIDKLDKHVAHKMKKSSEKNPETQTTGRPKRSCANKIDYSEIFVSSEKSKLGKNVDIILVDEGSHTKRRNVKLAPVFVKKIPKPIQDPAVLKARRNFLLSELPANLRAPIENQRHFEIKIVSDKMTPFPKVSHITQLNYKDKIINCKKNHYNFSIRMVENDTSYDINEKNIIMKYGTYTDCNHKDNDNSTIKKKDGKSKIIRDKKEAVSIAKKESGNFPINRCFKQILSKLQCAKKKDSVNENGISYMNSSFVDIFKPSRFEEILIGVEPVKQLQEFLNIWNDGFGSEKYDYESDDSNSRQSLKSMNNYVVLSGKNGSGKTSSVYALANELNYEIIEINAGTRRSGKKILQDLLEATQSHRVEKSLMDDESNLDNFQKDMTDRKTIIFIEDAELSFQNDDGFISSIQTLINLSKRPVILTTNDSKCLHLQKYIQQKEIVYDSPKNYLTKYLSLICIATANYQIAEDEIEYLCRLNRYDLRKTINEIEFFIRSENAFINSSSLKELFCNFKNSKELQKCSQKSTSSIDTDYSTLLSYSHQTIRASEKYYYQQNLMVEISNFFEESNLLKIKYRNDQQKTSNSSMSAEICMMNVSSRAKNLDYAPILRHICRTENIRETLKRTKRSHYLRNFVFNPYNVNDYFRKQCSIFQHDFE